MLLLLVSVNCSFVHICSIYKNVGFSWLDLIFFVILCSWLEYWLVLIWIFMFLDLWFLNVILIDLWFVSRIFRILLCLLN